MTSGVYVRTEANCRALSIANGKKWQKLSSEEKIDEDG